MTGPLVPYAAGFEEHLAGEGYRAYTVGRQVLLLVHVSGWLADQGLGAVDLTAARAQQFLHARREGGWAWPRSMRGMSPLLEYLRSIGAARISGWGVALTPVELLVERYRRYLVEERGLSPTSTVPGYLAAARTFLAHRSVETEGDLAGLCAADVTAFVLSESRRCKTSHAKSTTTRLRCLLRFLHVEGLIPVALSTAVPSVAGWRLSGLPEGPDAAVVARLLDSCDRRRTTGRRDFAILTILSRLALRAGEVSALQLGDLDWRTGEVTVRGKGRREDRLPLPHDVGEAIADWLQQGRPRCVCSAVFTRMLAPHHALSSGGVSSVVRQACRRVGFPPIGPHRLRHAVACEMLRTGGDLDEVGQVLRHRGSAVTSHYAKVDRRALAAVVQPWPGGVR